VVKINKMTKYRSLKKKLGTIMENKEVWVVSCYHSEGSPEGGSNFRLWLMSCKASSWFFMKGFSGGVVSFIKG